MEKKILAVDIGGSKMLAGVILLTENEEKTDDTPSLDEIAEKLGKEYPVLTRNTEFTGGFTINIDDTQS